MNRVEREITAPIKIDELRQLLDEMTPEEEQAITTRTRISDVQAAAAADLEKATPVTDEAAATIEPEVPRLFNSVDLDRFLTETVSKMVTPRPPRPMPPPIPPSLNDSSRPKRRYGRPFSQIAALLPPCEPPRSPRGTRQAPWTRVTPQTSRAVVEQEAPRTIAGLRARLDGGEMPALWAASSSLSPRVLAHLTAEEVAMLPAEIRGEAPEVPAADLAPRIERAAVPCAKVVPTSSARGAARLPAVPSQPQRSAAIVASLASMILLGICTVYFLI